MHMGLQAFPASCHFKPASTQLRQSVYLGGDEALAAVAAAITEITVRLKYMIAEMYANITVSVLVCEGLSLTDLEKAAMVNPNVRASSDL
jgi:hypothetical protein